VGDADQIVVDAAELCKWYDEAAGQMNERVAPSHVGGGRVRVMET